MRILFVTNMYPTSERPGYGTFVCQQAEQLRNCGHVVDVVNILGFQSKLNYLKGAFEVFQRTSRVAYDIVHAHYGLSAFSAWFRLKPPLVVTLHGGDVLGAPFERAFSRLIPRFADSIIVVSEEMRRKIPGIVIPCGVDLSVFKPYSREAARARLGWPKDRFLVLFPFDRTRALKRYDLAQAAVARMVQAGVDTELVTVSNAENREMPWYYSAADAMILCSDREGSPTAVKEALACNTPVVATDVGDVREILRGVVGARICTREVSDIARNLQEVLDIARSGRFDGRAAMAKYDQGHTIQKVLSVYNDVLRNRGLEQTA